MEFKDFFEKHQYMSCCYGIIFNDETKRNEFIESLKRNAKVELGKKISNGMTQKQLEEFGTMNSKESGKQWLEINCPEYSKLTKSVIQEVKIELVRSLGYIPDTIVNKEAIFRNTSVKELQLSNEARVCLEKDNILTIGEAVIFAHLKREPDIPQIYSEILHSAENYSKKNFPNEKNMTESIIREFEDE